MKICVLKGGWNSERDISLVTGESCAQALRSLGYDVVEYDVTPDILSLVQMLSTSKPDVVFNALHGRWGEDGSVQGLLNLMNIPYTHSGVLASSLSMYKPLAKKVFASNNVLTPRGDIFDVETIQQGHVYPVPYVVKPLAEGSSVGVAIIASDADLNALKLDIAYGDHYLVEEYIPGQEIHVAVMDGKAVGAIELRPHTGFYDYKAKYTPGFADHVMPADLSAKAYEQALRISENVFALFECRGVARLDFRYHREQDAFYLLEINTIPGMTPLSLVPEICAYHGISFQQIVQTLINLAQCDGENPHFVINSLEDKKVANGV